MKGKAAVGLLTILICSGELSILDANAAEIFNKNGNKIILNGMVDALHQFSSNAEDDGDESYARFGFLGETQVTDDLTGFGQWEYEVKVNKTESNDNNDASYTRLAYAGLKYKNLGSLDFGRNYGVLYDIGSWTDVFPVFGNDSYQDADRFMTGRAGNLLTWRNSDFFGLIEGFDVTLQYQGKNNGPEGVAERGEAQRNGDGYGSSAILNLDSGISLGVAWSSSERTNEQQKDNFGKQANAITTGLKYDANNILLAANYAKSKNIIHVDDYGWIKNADSWEIAGQYTFESGIQPGAAWIYTRARDLKGSTKTAEIVNYIDLSLKYSLNDHISTYVDYKINMLANKLDESKNPTGVNSDNIIGLGVTYEF